MRKVTLTLDDFSVVNNRLDLLLKLKAHFPNFKVSMFTIPIDKPMDYGPYLIRKDFLEEVKKHLDWIQIIPHGLYHDGREGRRWTEDEFRNDVIPMIIESFEADGLPFVRGFKTPHYSINEAVKIVLAEKGWRLFEKEGYALHQEWPDGDLLLRGHIYGCADDLGKNMDKLLRIPKDTIWKFII